MNLLRILGAVATLVVGAVHIQQFVGIIGDVPTVSELFLLNGIGAGVVAILLVVPRLRFAGALAGIGLSGGALVSLAISRYVEGGLFDYTETSFRAPVLVAVIAEVAAIGLLAGYAARARRAGAAAPLTT
jgi:hypothetical protein